MDNQLGKLTKWDYIIYLILFSIVLNRWFEFDPILIVAIIGIIVVPTLWYTDRQREKERDRKIKRLFKEELERDLSITEVLLRKIRQHKENNGDTIELRYLETKIFDSMINTHKIIILPEKLISELLELNNTFESINGIINVTLRQGKMGITTNLKIMSLWLNEAQGFLNKIIPKLEKEVLK